MKSGLLSTQQNTMIAHMQRNRGRDMCTNGDRSDGGGFETIKAGSVAFTP